MGHTPLPTNHRGRHRHYLLLSTFTFRKTAFGKSFAIAANAGAICLLSVTHPQSRRREYQSRERENQALSSGDVSD